MLSPSAAEQAVFFATHEIEPNDERLLLRYKKELDAVPLWILFLRPKSRQPLALQRLRTAGVPNFVWNRHKIGAQLLFAGPLSHLVSLAARAHWPMHAQKAFSPSFQWRVAQASPRTECTSAAKSRELRSVIVRIS